jgi:hypothetical protein
MENRLRKYWGSSRPHPFLDNLTIRRFVMRKEFEIEWPDLRTKVTAELLWKEAPRVCETIWKALPFESISVHAMISGQIFYNPTRIRIPLIIENVKSLHELNPGDITFSPLLSSNIVIVYGAVTEPMDQCWFAKTKASDVEKLKSVGVLMWENLMQKADLATHRCVKKPLKVIYRGKEY